MRIGIDLGGTKIEAILIDERGAELARQRIPTPQDDYEATVNAIAGLTRALEREQAVRARVGVGTPGAVSPATGVMKNCNSTWLNGRPLADDLCRELARPVRLANDANCFALSEATDGAGAGHDVVFGVIVGTGTGGGIVHAGRLLTGTNAIAGEWGHNPMPWPRLDSLWVETAQVAVPESPGPPCYCGKRGCIETYLSGPGLARDHQDNTGERLDAEGIVARAADGDSRAEATLERYEDRMARALASVINLIDPGVIVLGGGMSKVTRLYERVPPLLSRWVFSDHVATRLVPPRHGDSSGVRGAAWLWGPNEPEGGELGQDGDHDEFGP